jgi:hypothetical protein
MVSRLAIMMAPRPQQGYWVLMNSPRSGALGVGISRVGRWELSEALRNRRVSAVSVPRFEKLASELGAAREMVPYVQRRHHEDHVFRDIRRMIANALQVP